MLSRLHPCPDCGMVGSISPEGLTLAYIIEFLPDGLDYDVVGPSEKRASLDGMNGLQTFRGYS